MAKYSPRGGRSSRGGSKYGGRGGGSKYGSRGGSKYGSRGGGRSGGRGGGRYDDEDDYDEEPAYYGKGKTNPHEQAGILIFGGAVVVIIITVIFLAAGGGRKTIEKAMRVQKGGYYERDARQMAASQALGRARNFDKSNQYEDKEIVAQHYQDVVSQYPGTEAANEAQIMYEKVMQRRK
jgi:hypothetical protein